MKSPENTKSFFVIKCNNGNYLCRSILGAKPTNAPLKIEGVLETVLRFRNKKDAKEFLRFPNMDSLYCHFIDGATIEQVTIKQIIVIKEVK